MSSHARALLLVLLAAAGAQACAERPLARGAASEQSSVDVGAQPVVHATQSGAAAPAAPEAPAVSGRGDRRALIVGIDHYAAGTARDFPDLDGCRNDAHAARAALEQRFGFAPEQILVLEDAQATHEAIVRAFAAWLIEPAHAGDEALFWFSGHGSRVPDASGVANAEEGGLDSTLLAWDSRAGDRKGAYDLCDDELRSLVLALERKGVRTTVILDACHSGGAVRGLPERARVRAAPPGTQPFDGAAVAAFWPRDVPLLDDAQQELEPGGYVMLAACAPHQLALEVRVEDDAGGSVERGVFSFCLVRALESLGGAASWRSIAERVALEVAALQPGQTVWYEGGLEREPFEGRYRPAPEGLRARRLADGRLAIDAGALLGLRVGSQVGVLDGWSGARLCGARVVDVARLSAIAAPEVALPADALVLRVAEEARPPGVEPLPVRIEDPELAALFAASAIASVATAGDAYRISPQADPSGGAASLTLTTPDGLRVWRESAADAAEPDPAARRARAAVALERELRREQHYLALLALPRLGGALSARARFEEPTAADRERWPDLGPAPGADPRANRAGAGGCALPEYRAIGGGEGERRGAMLVLESDAREPVYASVVSVAEDRSQNPIWPPFGQTDRARLEPGAPLRIPILVVTVPEWPLEREMRDRYVILLTKTPLDLSGFRPEAARTTRSGATPADAQLAFALSGWEQRGGSLVRRDGGEFGVAEVDLLVRPAGGR